MTSNQTISFLHDWAKFHENQHPIGFALRRNPMLPWVRFHALPESKRYADTEEEMLTILDRGNQLGSELLGPNSICWLIYIPYPYKDVAVPGELAYSWDEDEGDPFSRVWQFFVTKVKWSEGAYDDDLEDVAEDVKYAVWFNPRTGAVFAPYDGGFDLFPQSADEVENLRCRHADWLSDHEEGL